MSMAGLKIRHSANRDKLKAETKELCTRDNGDELDSSSPTDLEFLSE